MESGHRREINYSFKQNYGEPRASFSHMECNIPVHNQSKSSALYNHGYGNNPGVDGYRNSNHDSSYQEQRRDINKQFLQQHRMEPQSSYYSQGFKAQPPMPTSLPTPLPMEPPRFPIWEPVSSSAPSFHLPYSTVSEAITPVSSHFTNKGYPNSSGYHLEGCSARNVHGFTQNDISKMANQREDAPALYMKLDDKLFIDYFSLHRQCGMMRTLQD